MSPMSRGVIVRLLLVIGLLAGCAALALNIKPRLGLDLRGGTQIIMEASDGPNGVEANRTNTDQTLEVLRGRVDSLGVSEPTLVRSGENRIIVELPDVQDPQEALEVLGKTAQLGVHQVLRTFTTEEEVEAAGLKVSWPAGQDPDGDSEETGDEATEEPTAEPTEEPTDEKSDKKSEKSGKKAQGKKAKGKNNKADKKSDKAGQDGAASDEATQEPADEAQAEDESGENVVYPSKDGTEFLELAPASITGSEIKKAASAQPQNQTYYVVDITFDGKAGDVWAKLTGDAACARDADPNDPKSRTAIALDNTVLTAPVPSENVACNVGIVGGQTQIDRFSLEESKDLATLIQGGALPLPVEAISVSEVGPTLGKDAIKASWQAGIIGLILTGLFIAFAYRLVGLLATVALTSYALLSYAMLVTIGSTLTLPGLAGFVLAIGLAIDANVLVFERAREEYLANPGAGLRKALMTGFTKAWSAIIDSNVTTLLAAGLLFFLGSGPIKGFGVTLTIGTVASMISALVIARVLTEVVVSTRAVNKRPAISGIGHQSKVRQWLEGSSIDLMKRRATWLAVSVAAMAIAVAGIVVNGLNLGVEFTGGRSIEYTTTQPVDADQAREAVADAGFAEAVVQESGGKITVRTGDLTNDEVQQIDDAIARVGGGAEQLTDNRIGASLGDELRRNALIAFGVAFAAQLLYLAVRFKWTFGLAAVAAMAHDVLLVLGIFAWLGKPVDGIFLAAAMTIIGLSVNDTVVVFDRVRERWYASRPGDDFTKLANQACLETVPRTVNTGLGAMFILAALAVLGGDSLQDFAIALLLGLIVGTYSSVFAATPLVTYLQEKWPMSPVKKVRVERDPEDSGAVV